jgi:Ran-binding protein 9/10
MMKADAFRSSFFIPSYLKGLRHAERLEEAHKASLAAARDARSAHSSNAGSLSTSSSSINLHKMVPTHRGLASEVIERAPPTPIYPEDAPAPLPSRWNDNDKFSGLDLMNGGLELKYNGVPKPNDSEAAAVRADHPMPRECGIYYYEVTVVSKSKDGYVSDTLGRMRAAC